MNKWFLLFVFFISVWKVEGQPEVSLRPVLDLSGTWGFSLDSANVGIQEGFFNRRWKETVKLPGTTDTNQKGYKNENREETTHLSRLYTYEGPAWYSREISIPRVWEGKRIFLFLERTRPSQVWVDGHRIGENHHISVPHRYELTPWVSPGQTHHLVIRIDNGESIPQQIRSSSHACTESTQTNWNGIIGRMELEAVHPCHIASIQVYPDVKNRCVKVVTELSQPAEEGDKLTLSAASFNTSRARKTKPLEFILEKGRLNYEFTYPLGEKARLWSEFEPVLYRLTADLAGKDKRAVVFGLRDFVVSGTQFTINGMPTFLRGKHDACVFPLTAHTAMDVESWRRYFRIARSYGLNHCRFHSWCPPEACFQAADLEGVYLQPELPIWGALETKEKSLLTFLMQEGESIQKEYGNHTSFVMFALGNELWGEADLMKTFVGHFRQIDNRHLYAYGSNNFLGFKGHIEGEDYLTTCRIGGGEGYSTHTRGSFSFADAEEGGWINNTYPNSVMNFAAPIRSCPVPVISHETGQFQIYLNYQEMKKYTGVLAPWNFEVFRRRLEKAGMLEQAEDFFRASGALSLLLYRADIEMNLRTPGLAGFQLLDLQDYPGQGSAYVGVLDAFMDSKGLVSPAKWREFCSEIVPLFVTEKFCWVSGEMFSGRIKLADYSAETGRGKKVKWVLALDSVPFAKGQSKIPGGKGLLLLDSLCFRLPSIQKACKMELKLEVPGTAYRNSYPLWLYPANKEVSDTGGVLVARALTGQVMERLCQGERVLLMPRQEDCGETTVGGLFQSDYWNYRMFKSICDRIQKPASPGTLGLLIRSEHPLFKDFPTDYHTDWQWYPIIRQSYPLVLDSLPAGYQPIVQVIDNVERNHKLGLVFEVNVGKGKLLVCMANLEAVMDKPEVRQFYKSLLRYMQSTTFAPAVSVSPEALQNLLHGKAETEAIEKLDNISYE